MKVHTDHKNLTYKTFNSKRVMRWRLYIEEYSPDLQYIKGTHNIVADALSQLDISDETLKDTTDTFLGLMECFVTSRTAKEIMDFQPLNYQQLQKAQLRDKTMMKLQKDDKTAY